MNKVILKRDFTLLKRNFVIYQHMYLELIAEINKSIISIAAPIGKTGKSGIGIFVVYIIECRSRSTRSFSGWSRSRNFVSAQILTLRYTYR